MSEGTLPGLLGQKAVTRPEAIALRVGERAFSSPATWDLEAMGLTVDRDLRR